MAEQPTEVDVDLTPMIDCTFLLIIFFMLVIKMSNDELEPVELPKAEQAEEDKAEDQDRLIINLAKAGKTSAGKPAYKVVVGGEDMTPAHSGGTWQVSGSKLEKRLVMEADLRGKQFSERQVLIRADKDCPYEFVAMLMAALTRPSVKIFKIQLGAAKVESGAGER